MAVLFMGLMVGSFFAVAAELEPEDPARPYLERADEFYARSEFGFALQNLLFARDISPGLSDDFSFGFRLAYCYRQLDSTRQAWATFQRLGGDGRFGDYALFQLLDMHNKSPDSLGTSVQCGRVLLQCFPKSVFAAQTELTLAELHLERRDFSNAQLFLTAAERTVLSDPYFRRLYEPRLVFLKGRLYSEQKQYAKAINTWRLLQSEFPYADEAYAARQMIETTRRSAGIATNGEQFLESTNVLILQGHYQEALNELAAARNRYSSSEMQRKIELQIAKVYFAQGMYPAAIPRYRNAWRKYRDHESLIRLARAARYAGDLALSNRTFYDYLEAVPLTGVWRSYILIEIANNYSAMNDTADWREANRLYARVRQNTPASTVYGSSAAFREGFNLYKLGEWEAALIRFEDLERRVPTQRTRCGFWKARTLEHMGRHAEARSVYDSLAAERFADYYGMLSFFASESGDSIALQPLFYTTPSAPTFPSIAFGSLNDEWVPRLDVEDPSPSEASRDSVWDRATASVRMLGPATAERELRRLQEAYFYSYERTHLLRRYAEQVGAYDLAVDAASLLQSKYRWRLSTAYEQYRLSHPVYYLPAVHRYAARYQLDPFLLLAVLRTESAFRSQAISGARAVGLMQIMPFTGNAIARELHVEGFDMMMLLNPETSIRFGSHYLAAQRDTFGGYIPAILAAYNAGPHRAAFWMHQHRPLDPAEFPEAVDLLETHNYIRRIMLDRWIYSQLYSS
jgi:soluble lytic murein transglycosylase